MVLLFILTILVAVIKTITDNPDVDATTKLVVGFVGTLFGLGIMWGAVRPWFSKSRA